MPTPSPETVAHARRMYAAGARVCDICAATGLSVGTLYHHLDGGNLGRGRKAALPRRRMVVGEKVRPLKGDRTALAARLWRTAERQVRDIELRLADPATPPEQKSRDVTALAQLTRMLRDLAVFEAHGASPAASAAPRESEVSRALGESYARARLLEAQVAALKLRQSR